MQKKKLFTAINKHLLQDESPSTYLNEVCNLSEFKEYPFNMLLDLKETEQEPIHHPEGNVWNHTMLVLDEAAKRREKSNNVKVFMWAALLHDLGKPAATQLRNGKLTAYDHDKIGEKLSRKFLLAVDAPETFIEQVSSLVRFHMHILYVVKNMPFGDIKGLKKHANLDEVALLGLCDRLGRTNANLKKEEKNIELFLSKLMKRKDIIMAKAGMKRPDPKEPHGTESNHKSRFPKNSTEPVPEIQGKAKSGKERASKV